LRTLSLPRIFASEWFFFPFFSNISSFPCLPVACSFFPLVFPHSGERRISWRRRPPPLFFLSAGTLSFLSFFLSESGGFPLPYRRDFFGRTFFSYHQVHTVFFPFLSVDFSFQRVVECSFGQVKTPFLSSGRRFFLLPFFPPNGSFRYLSLTVPSSFFITGELSFLFCRRGQLESPLCFFLLSQHALLASERAGDIVYPSR